MSKEEDQKAVSGYAKLTKFGRVLFLTWFFGSAIYEPIVVIIYLPRMAKLGRLANRGVFNTPALKQLLWQKIWDTDFAGLALSLVPFALLAFAKVLMWVIKGFRKG